MSVLRFMSFLAMRAAGALRHGYMTTRDDEASRQDAENPG